MSIFVERAMEFAANRPNDIIVFDKWRTWTWSELIDRAVTYRRAVVARFSAQLPSQIVPILVGRGGDAVAAVLGTLMAGRAVAPISPRQPAVRLRRCLHSVGTNDVLEARAPEERRALDASINVLEPERRGSDGLACPDTDPESLVYVLFTSGSTGEPKGVMVSHANILNTMLWSVDLIDWRDGDVIGGATQFSFDIANFDLFTTFYYGVPLSLFPDPSDVHDVSRRIANTGVTSIFAVPAFFSQFVRARLLPALAKTSLRRILSGGDFFPPPHILEWLSEAPQVELHNVWGPTETSIVNTIYKVGPKDREMLQRGQYPAVGSFHPRMPFVLVNRSGHEVKSPGDRGEIWMLGDCVTQGYLDEAQSREVYVTYKGQRAFRTQDIGYVDEQDRLYLAGRTGSIVKVSGYRIDLGEVEGAVAGLQEVHMAGAFVNEAAVGISELWVAVELRPGVDKLDIFAAKRSLRKILPRYMVPKRLVVLPGLPLSPNSKVDRRAIERMFAERRQEVHSHPPRHSAAER